MCNWTNNRGGNNLLVCWCAGDVYSVLGAVSRIYRDRVRSIISWLNKTIKLMAILGMREPK